MMRNKWMVLWFGLLGSVLGSALTNALWWSSRDAHAAPSQDEATKARKFQLVDSKGNVCGEWGTVDWKEGTSSHFWLKTKKHGGIGMSVQSDGGVGISMARAHDEKMYVPQIVISLDKDRKPHAYIQGTDGDKLTTVWEVGK